MDVRYMTLDGRVDRSEFVKEWALSTDRAATYIQTKDTIYLMPYGQWSPESKDLLERFTGSSRRHTYVQRDFRIADAIVGGGFLTLDRRGISCTHSRFSIDFGGVDDPRLIVAAVDAFFFASEPTPASEHP